MAATRLFIDLYLDADVDKKLAAAIRREGFDAVSARELPNEKFSDVAQLEFAIIQRRAILTHNAQHFALLYDEYWHKKRTHYGIIVSEQLPFGVMFKRILALLDSITADEMMNSYRDLGQFK